MSEPFNFELSSYNRAKIDQLVAEVDRLTAERDALRARLDGEAGRLPRGWRADHVREPDRNEPDVCVHCRLPWCDLFTDRPEDECPVRLRAALDARAPLRWERHPNNPNASSLIVGSGPNEITIGHLRSGYDHHLGHVATVLVGSWAETAHWTRTEAAARLYRHLGLDASAVRGTP